MQSGSCGTNEEDALADEQQTTMTKSLNSCKHSTSDNLGYQIQESGCSQSSQQAVDSIAEVEVEPGWDAKPPCPSTDPQSISGQATDFVGCHFASTYLEKSAQIIAILSLSQV